MEATPRIFPSPLKGAKNLEYYSRWQFIAEAILVLAGQIRAFSFLVGSLKHFKNSQSRN